MLAIGYWGKRDVSGRSLGDLERAFGDYCELNLHQPVRLFALAAVGEAEPAAEYRDMIEFMAGAGNQYLVVVPGAADLGADLETVVKAVVQLDGMGAKVVCDAEDFPDPLQNALQTLGVKGVSRTRSRSIQASMRERASRGLVLGKPPFGYGIGRDRRLEVAPQEAPVVELIFRLYTRDKLGLRLIAQRLNDRGIRTRRDGSWNTASIRELLKNPVYMGTYTRLGMRRPGAHEPIIPSDVFRAAQDITESRRPMGRVARPEPFLLSGIVYCGYCSNKMMGVTRRQSWKRKDSRRASGTYRYYQCQSRNNQSRCDYHTWRAPLLEGMVVGQLGHALAATPDTAGDPIDLDARSRKSLETRRAQVANAERRLLQATKRASRGTIGLTTLAAHMDELDSARQSLAASDGLGQPGAVLERWDSLDFAARKAFLAEHVDRVVVKDETVDVRL